MIQWTRLGELLQQQFGIEAETIAAALEVQAEQNGRLGDILSERFGLSGKILGAALAKQFNLPFFETLPEPTGVGELIERLPLGYVREQRIFPLEQDKGRLLLAVADPGNGKAVNDLVALTGNQVEICLATEEEILAAVNRAYEQQADKTDNLAPDIGSSDDGLEPQLEPADLLDTSDEAPIIRFVNSLLTKAYRERASDIHLEPFETELVVRYRIDGILYEVLRPPQRAHAAIISRLKIMAGLDIAEKRLPQDGRFRVRIAGKDLDVRVSSLPTAFGERLVLRLLEKSSSVLDLADIGMDRKLLQQLGGLITQPHGIFLVTGPTGSGKTTTLYAALTRLNNREKNIITVEDPIEYQLTGISQIQVNPKIDLTFAAGLRSILRQDPDIIMVGEIRDGETAEIAVQSALTGHMVFSTLHTNDAAGALTRLTEMGIEPFLAASSISGILAQRLVRRLCPHCRQAYTPTPEVLAEIGSGISLPPKVKFYQGRGCDECLQIGYRGRTGIYELLVMDDRIRDLLMQGKDATSIRHAAQQAGMLSLRHSGLNKVLAGETSLEEVLRVTQDET
ncbi:type II secretion system protein GspE [Geothermobacter hydrogeniphilus]|uniref:protein-secreting ATPase n=1 Tax=Geothermobacter hydrogeniphilus TaxID=1969733 RepID=A0A2K2H9E3_9BACT|nr:type II secretion system ATPase GspE [Geothermobacter hydrogeniphilus]PNU19839.1 type II secretion system protein GspE [Geothermobacter hydrogeniphilus]